MTLTVLLAVINLQKNHHSWMSDSWELLNGEVVEREVATAYKVLYKTSKILNQRGLEKNAENCDVIRNEVEDFKKFVPLVQVRGWFTAVGSYATAVMC